MSDLFKHQMVPTNGTELHVVTSGSGFPVVLLHGFPQTWYEWRHIIPALSADFQIIAPDLRGMGDSAPMNTGQDKRTLANDIRELLRAFGLERVIVVGHDWGGAVAQRFALDFPELTEGLVCIDIPYFPLLPPFHERPWPPSQLIHSWYIFLQQDTTLPEKIAEACGEDYLRWFFEHGSGSGGSPFSDEDIKEYTRWFTQPGRATAGFNLYRMMSTVDVEHWLADRHRQLDIPTLWIQGMEDPFVPPSRLEALESVFTNLRVERLQGCGHWVPEERPQETAAVLLDFLRGPKTT